MTRKWTIPFLGLLMALLLATPALAAVEYGVIYDETEQLRSEPLVYAGETTLPALTEQYGIDLRVDVLAQSDYDTVLDAAEGIYEEYEYGYGENRSGITLTLLLSPSGDVYRMEPGDWCVYLGGTDEDLMYGDWLTDIADAVEPYMAEQAWSGDMDMSAIALSQAVDAMANAVEDCFGDGSRSDHTPAPEQEEAERQLGYSNETGSWDPAESSMSDMTAEDFWALDPAGDPLSLTPFSGTEVGSANEFGVPVSVQYLKEAEDVDCDWVTLYDGPDACCILFTAGSRVTDFTLLNLFAEDSTETGAVIFSATAVEADSLPAVMTPDAQVAVQLLFPGDLPAYGISYVDGGGNLRRFALVQSGCDGSVLLEETDPNETQFILPGIVSR